MNTFSLRKYLLRISKENQGFTLIEVLVGILIATTFTLVAMQAVVLAAYFKVKAKVTAEGTLIIQEDLEEIRYRAFDYYRSSTAPYYPSDAPQCNPTVVADGFAEALKTDLGTTGAYQVSDPVPSDVFTDSNGNPTREYEVSRYFEASTTAPYNVLKIDYKVLDKASPDYQDSTTVNPHDPSNEANIASYNVAELYTEVIPDAAFSCN